MFNILEKTGGCLTFLKRIPLKKKKKNHKFSMRDHSDCKKCQYVLVNIKLYMAKCTSFVHFFHTKTTSCIFWIIKNIILQSLPQVILKHSCACAFNNEVLVCILYWINYSSLLIHTDMKTETELSQLRIRLNRLWHKRYAREREGERERDRFHFLSPNFITPWFCGDFTTKLNSWWSIIKISLILSWGKNMTTESTWNSCSI